MTFSIRWTILASWFISLLIAACTPASAPIINIPPPLTTPTRHISSAAPASIAPQTPTSQPSTSMPKPTAILTSPSVSTQASAPKILSFTVVPTTTNVIGEHISMAWQSQGAQAKLCPYVMTLSGPSAQEPACAIVPLAGTKVITVTQNDLDWNGMMLQVTSGTASDRSTVAIALGCEGLNNWFFRDAPARCPSAAPINSPAAAQRFERGMMIWVKQPDRFYVFYNENPQVFEWIEAPYRFKPGVSANNRMGEKPPSGSFEPVSGFGQLWRGEIEGVQNVRQRLGWAKEQEFDFNTFYQCARTIASSRLWTCYLASPSGKVIELSPDSTAQAHFIWQER